MKSLPTISRFAQGAKLLSIATLILLEDEVSTGVLPIKQVEGTLVNVVTTKLTPQLHINHFSEYQIHLMNSLYSSRDIVSDKNGIEMIFVFKDKSSLSILLKAKGQIARPMFNSGYTTQP